MDEKEFLEAIDKLDLKKIKALLKENQALIHLGDHHTLIQIGLWKKDIPFLDFLVELGVNILDYKEEFDLNIFSVSCFHFDLDLIAWSLLTYIRTKIKIDKEQSFHSVLNDLFVKPHKHGWTIREVLIESLEDEKRLEPIKRTKGVLEKKKQTLRFLDFISIYLAKISFIGSYFELVSEFKRSQLYS